MKTYLIRTLTFTLALLLSSVMYAQKGVEDGSKYGHGEDSIRALTNLSLYKQFYKQKNYTDAIKAWRIVFFEAPKASKNMYIHGNVMYKTFWKKCKDKNLREKYVDTIMMIYDQKIKWFGQEGYLTGRKGIDLHMLSKSREKEAYDLLLKSLTMMGNKTPEYVINELMQASLTLYLDKKIEKEDIVNNFAKSSEILSYEIKNCKKDKKLKKIQTVIDNVELIFTKSGAADCESLVPVLQPKFDAAPNDVDVLKNIVNLLRTTNCEETDLYEHAAVNLYKIEPSANAAYGIARVYLQKKELDKAIEYYNEAIKSETDELTLSRYYQELANIMLAAGKSAAKIVETAQQSLKYNKNSGEPYLTMGHAYASIKKYGDNAFQAKTVFWIAVDMFAKAKAVDPSLTEKANKYIATYSKYFPSKEEAFFNDVSEGVTYKVKGWINRSTTARFSK